MDSQLVLPTTTTADYLSPELKKAVAGDILMETVPLVVVEQPLHPGMHRRASHHLDSRIILGEIKYAARVSRINFHNVLEATLLSLALWCIRLVALRDFAKHPPSGSSSDASLRWTTHATNYALLASIILYVCSAIYSLLCMVKLDNFIAVHSKTSSSSWRHSACNHAVHHEHEEGGGHDDAESQHDDMERHQFVATLEQRLALRKCRSALALELRWATILRRLAIVSAVAGLWMYREFCLGPQML